MRTEFSYGNKVQQQREEKSWTQEQLADAASLDVRTIQRVEKGQTKNPETIQAIAGALDVDVDKLRTTRLIPETRLAGTWLVTNHREFLSVERTRPAQQFARLTASPLTEEGQRRIDELLRLVFADRQNFSPVEPELWECYEQQVHEPLQELFGLGQAMFVMDERKDLILPDLGDPKPLRPWIENWRALYYIVVPRHGCFQVDPKSSMHRFNPDCHEAGDTIFRAAKHAGSGVGVYANAVLALDPSGDESRIHWCDVCFPPSSNGLRIGIEYITSVTGKDPAELYADYLEATGNTFIVGLS